MKHFFALLALATFYSGTATASDFATSMMDATFKLFNKDSTATCFILREGLEKDASFYLVTAAHVLEKAKGETAIIVLRKPDAKGAFSRVDYEIRIRKEDQALWKRHAKHDIAVLELAGDFPVEVAALPLSCLADAKSLEAAKVHVCSPLFIFAFPERFEANGAGFPVARQGIFSSPPLLPSDSHPTFLADFTTFSGDSGGPAFVEAEEDKPLIVGVVLGKHHHNEKVNSQYGDQQLRHPLNIGILLHARYVSDTLALLKTQSE